MYYNNGQVRWSMSSKVQKSTRRIQSFRPWQYSFRPNQVQNSLSSSHSWILSFISLCSRPKDYELQVMEESAQKRSSKSSWVAFVPFSPFRSPGLSSSQNVCDARCTVKGSWQHNQALLCPFHQKSKKRLEESLSMLPHIMYIQETHVLLLVLRTICVWLVCKDTTALPLGSLSSFLCNLYRIKMNPPESHVCHS